jgi:hypothetical protein
LLSICNGKFLHIIALTMNDVSDQLKGEEHAILYKPPNHKLFDPDKPVVSPVLQKRLAAAAAGPSNASAPVFNVTLGNELVGLFQPQAPPPLPPAALTHNTPLQYDLACPLLLPPTQTSGTDMTLNDFCAKYDLSPTILQKLHENSYTNACMLRFVMIDKLCKMGFRLGEMAALRDALRCGQLSNLHNTNAYVPMDFRSGQSLGPP